MRVAAVDIGTNTVRLLLADQYGPIWRTEAITGLGRGVDRVGELSQAAIQRTLAELSAFAPAVIEADRVAVVATSASRDARNRDEFFAAVEATLRTRPQLIDGDREAELAYRGARPPGTAGPVTIVDLGGGSTEVVSGSSDVPDFRRSFDVGSVRISDRWLAARPEHRRLQDARDDIAATIDTGPDNPGLVLGVGGTFETLAVMTGQAVDGATITAATLANIVGELAALPTDAIAARGDVPAGRAGVILGGALVAAGVVSRLAVTQVTVSERGLLDGLAAELLAQST